jgi:hypothetical protein
MPAQPGWPPAALPIQPAVQPKKDHVKVITIAVIVVVVLVLAALLAVMIFGPKASTTSTPTTPATTNTNTNNGTNNGTNTNNGTGTDNDNGSGSGTGTGNGSGTDNNNGAGTGNGSGSTTPSQPDNVLGSTPATPGSEQAQLQELKQELEAAAQANGVGPATKADPMSGNWLYIEGKGYGLMQFKQGAFKWYKSKKDLKDNYKVADYEILPGMQTNSGISFGTSEIADYTVFVHYSQIKMNGKAQAYDVYGEFEIGYESNGQMALFYNATTGDELNLVRES